MSDMPPSSKKLEAAAYEVADEYRSGQLDALKEREWPRTWRNLLAELKTRCPGASDAEYRSALEGGFVASR